MRVILEEATTRRLGGTSVSWIVFVFLVSYGSLRLVLWIRGQVRFALHKSELPGFPAPLPRPHHLSHRLGELMDCTYSERVHLIESLRSILTVMITDPDVPLGCVRDFRYRLAVFHAWAAARRWIGLIDSLPGPDRARLRALGCRPEVFVRNSRVLKEVARETSNARALEPFALDGVERTQTCLDNLIHQLALTEHYLGQNSADPYRAGAG